MLLVSAERQTTFRRGKNGGMNISNALSKNESYGKINYMLQLIFRLIFA